MKKHSNLQIDIIGNCGFKSPELPSRAERERGSIKAYPILAQNYKFYLSFENAKCFEYITEKFFTALQVGMLPVVMGGLSKQDYEKIAPPHSFIHVDDFSSPKHLMQFLEKLSKDPKEYNTYFWWKSYYDPNIITEGRFHAWSKY